MEFIPSGNQDRSALEASLKNTVLIWPAVSIGNVGQLCVDLLINTVDIFHLKKVGVIASKRALPLVGYLGINSDQLTFALELYYSAEWSVTVVQQRTPIIQGKEEEFCEEAATWIAAVQFSSVLILASSPAYRRSDDQLQAESRNAVFGYEAWPLHSSVAEAIQKANICRVQECLFSHLTQFFDEREQEKDDDLSLPTIGTGFSRPLFLACQRRQIDVAVVYSFVDEGDNSLDGIMQGNLLYRILSHLAKDHEQSAQEPIYWKIPPEWQFVFGGQSVPYVYLQ